MYWRDLSTVLGFHHKCTTDVEQATRSYHKESFWHSISRLNTYSQPRCNDIQHPTLCLMHKWLALMCFPRDDVQTICIDELRILYAMVNKIKIAPMHEMVRQWLGNFRMVEPVESTSLVTRIATSLCVLNWAQISYITIPRPKINLAYLVQGHTLKSAPDGSIIFYFPVYVNESPLPNPKLCLYKSRCSL